MANGFIVDARYNNNEAYKGPGMFKVLVYAFDGKRGWKFANKDVPENKLIELMRTGKISLRNAEIGEDGRVTGRYCNFNRCCLNRKNGANPPLTIIAEMRTDDEANRLVGYKVAMADGQVKNYRCSDIYKLCKRAVSQKNYPVFNGMFVDTEEGRAEHIRRYPGDNYLVHLLEMHKPSAPVDKTKKVYEDPISKSDTSKRKLSDEFTPEQINELRIGKNNGVNIRMYGNNKLSAAQMKEIRKAMENGVDPGLFNKPEFSAEAMRSYRIQMKYGVDVSAFINPEYKPDQIMEIVTAWIDGVDISKIADPKKDAHQMSKERVELTAELYNAEQQIVTELLNDFR